MRKLIYLFIGSLCYVSNCLGQEIVSGYLEIPNTEEWEQKVHLSEVQLDSITNTYTYIPISSSTLSDDGYFSFDKKWFDAKDQLYKIHIKTYKSKTEKEIAINHSKLFIVSKNDSIHFDKSISFFDSYTTNNKANQEWQQLKRFESKFESLHNDFNTDEYLLKTKGYIKDSLQILLVKLISIKRLNDKKLLEKDIKDNTTYYTDLLDQLKSSEIDPALFIYLENKISKIQEANTDKKYSISLISNSVAALIIVLLIFLLIRKRKNNQNTLLVPLSKQENTIKQLILSGKSNKEIATELFISVNTVKTHISNIYSKLNISNRKELLLKK